MKRELTTLMAAILMTTIAGFAVAQEEEDGMRPGRMMHGGRMGEREAMQGDMPMMGMMRGGMMGGMMRPEVTPTEDGGIVVLVGNMLLKYDKNLELVKKTELAISDEETMNMMKKMHQRHMRCRQMMMDMQKQTEKEAEE